MGKNSGANRSAELQNYSMKLRPIILAALLALSASVASAADYGAVQTGGRGKDES